MEGREWRVKGKAQAKGGGRKGGIGRGTGTMTFTAFVCLADSGLTTAL